MSINSLTTSAASQLAYTSRVSGTSSTSSTSSSQAVRQAPPARPDDGGGLIGAIADALKSIGVASTEDTSTASTDGTTSSSDTTSTGNAAQALGTFLESLMGALHAQNAGSGSDAGDGGTPPYGEPPQGGPGMGGGPGKLSSDLESLIASLSEGTGNTDSQSATESTGTDSTVGTLQSTFKDLLSALGSDSADATTQLTSFLQSLSSKLPSAGSTGNLINTSA
ncbi:hypothetical protein IP91_00425 [Pseudoduganella lurida]|uniref:Uncharacterized protein n=1 Tax=Pseudoduganella lurida TaxID=1036180 RepID=A0A562RJW9_9BURK|nr:hypothetical protein [Pseudoduganella lurida]TWI69357.1 hypothetical protein IP91_00425 [Pseudoduganella lurida]